MINKVPEDKRINNKTEWNQPGKITVEFQKDGKRKIKSEIEKIKTETKKSDVHNQFQLQ